MTVIEPLVEVENLTHTYRHAARPALDTVSLAIQPGQIAALVGHNGAGKTTMIRIMTGVLRPTAGSVRLARRALYQDRVQMAAAKRLTGVVADNPPLYGRLTAREFVRFSARIYGLADSPHLERRISGLLASVELDEDADRRIVGYSLGMRKKTAVCAALVHDPALLIMDEPFDGLDPLVRRSLKGALRAYAARGRAVLLSTHALELAQELCDRIIAIHRGRLIADGSVDDLRAMVGAVEDAPLEDVFFLLIDRQRSILGAAVLAPGSETGVAS